MMYRRGHVHWCWGRMCKPSPPPLYQLPGSPMLCPSLLTHTCGLRRFLLLCPSVFAFWAIPNNRQFCEWAPLLKPVSPPPAQVPHRSIPNHPLCLPSDRHQWPKADVLSEKRIKCWNNRRFEHAVHHYLVISMHSTLSVKLSIVLSCIKW